ncbi:hypothetical protein Tco_0595207 [Tanacetum coccineum]
MFILAPEVLTRDDNFTTSMGDNSSFEGNVPSSSGLNTQRKLPENISQVQPGIRKSSRYVKMPAKRLHHKLVADGELANNLLHDLNRYLEQLCTRAQELLRVEALPDDPLIKYGFSVMERASFFDMTNSNNLVAVMTELL